jgi:DNA polymerase elongation subunit (family B)
MCRNYYGYVDFEINTNIDGAQIEFGLGGIHASRTGIFKSDNEFITIDIDAASYYPNLAIQNLFYMAHLGIEFIEVYQDMINTRIDAKRKAKDKSFSVEERNKFAVIADGFKLAANSIYGKSSQETSFLYDVKYTYSVTINGQLSLLMLIEMLSEALSGFTLIQANTDGITIQMLNDVVNNEMFKIVLKSWEDLNQIELECNYYKAMFIRDCNNYIALGFDNKVKLKGAYEVDKLIGSEIVYHKDSSFRIVQIAVRDYFIKGIAVETTIKSHNAVRDFMGRIKFSREFKGILEWYDPNDIFGKIIQVETEKVTRYYVSTVRKKFVKVTLKTGKRTAINKEYFVSLAQILPDKIPNDIDYQFYINESLKLINAIKYGKS